MILFLKGCGNAVFFCCSWVFLTITSRETLPSRFVTGSAENGTGFCSEALKRRNRERKSLDFPRMLILKIH